MKRMVAQATGAQSSVHGPPACRSNRATAVSIPRRAVASYSWREHARRIHETDDREHGVPDGEVRSGST